jgi:hypothetical protein
MVIIPFTIDPRVRFGPMLQAFLTTTHHPHQKPWHTTHTNYKYHWPNANLLYEPASQLPCPLGILSSADLRWAQSASRLANTTDVLWQLLHRIHTKFTYSPISNSSDSAYLRHTAHYYVILPLRSNFIPQPPHLTSTRSSLWKIHTPYLHT